MRLNLSLSSMGTPRSYNRDMDSNPSRLLALVARFVPALAATMTCLSAYAWNHTDTVSPLGLGQLPVACSNIAQDTSRIPPGASASDYWEGRPVNGQHHYITQILPNPQPLVRFAAPVPADRSLSLRHARGTVAFVPLVSDPTSPG